MASASWRIQIQLRRSGFGRTEALGHSIKADIRNWVPSLTLRAPLRTPPDTAGRFDYSSARPSVATAITAMPSARLVATITRIWFSCGAAAAQSCAATAFCSRLNGAVRMCA